MLDIKVYILLFFIYSMCGWIMECIDLLIKEKRFINRGFLVGPYCPIYGTGAILMTILLQKFIDQPIILFLMCLLICSVLEYVTSYFMEKLFHARWWDYSKDKFNINGRICLGTMIPFGLLGCFITYVSNPFLIKKIGYFSNEISSLICILLLTIFVIDSVISMNIIKNIKITSKNIKDNTEEITQKVKEILSKKSYFTKRIVDAFPDMKIIKDKIKDKIKKKIMER